MDYSYYPAIAIHTVWFTDLQTVQPYIDSVLKLGYSIREIHKRKKYRFFGQVQYQVEMINTLHGLIHKRQELIFQSEQYELVPTVDSMINMIKQSQPAIIPLP
jgi:hypothetical protein